MRALIEDTKKLSVNNNNNNINNNSTTGTIAKTKSAGATVRVAGNTKKSQALAQAQAQPQPKQQQQQGANKTSFVNRTYKMQQQSTINQTTNAKKGTATATASAAPPTAGVKLRAKQPQAQQLKQQSKTKTESCNNNAPANTAVSVGASTVALPKTTTVAHMAPTTSSSSTITNASEEIAGGVQDTIYLCNFRVSVDGDWLCLKELQDIDSTPAASASSVMGGGAAGGGQRHASSHKHKRYSAGDRYSYGGGAFEDNARDPSEIERSNLVNICKLVVKELLEQSVRYGRMLDSDHLPLQHFFIVIEHVLGHGLRTKKGLLGPRKELWDLLQCVETFCPEAQDITTSVRDLPTVRTHIGRARAWLRIALMQKKLADYLQALIEHREDALFDYYEPHALMMSDEIVIIMGILVGLNVIDCNLCVKEEDLDSQQGVIDFSLYLRSSSRSNDTEEECNQTIDANGQGNMIAVLDQKNYIEELNRHLNATVTNLQAKVESLTTTNALMKEDLAIARNSLLALQAENQAMRQTSQTNAGPPSLSSQHSDNSSNSSKESDKATLESLKSDLDKEKKKNVELEKELKLQVALKAESDMAMKLLEKDIHEKQDTIVSLRLQLDEIKQINLEMYRKLQECEASLKHKSDMLMKLESQKEDMATTIAHLEKKWSNDKVNLGEILKTTSQTLSTQVSASEERATRAENELRKERELRMSLQESELQLKEQIRTLDNYIKELDGDLRSLRKLQPELDQIRHQWSEAQTTLEELGIQLSESKLKVAELQDREKERKHDAHDASMSPTASETSQTTASGTVPGIWAPDSIASHCTACRKEFNLTRRKHHCRSCGEIFCRACSDHTLPLLNESGQLGKPVRVCLACFASHK